MKKGYRLLEYLDKNDIRQGNIENAKAAAVKIAEYLKKSYGAAVFGIGSLYIPGKKFTERSDIDLVVKGIPKGKYFSILEIVNNMTDFEIELVPWEDANEYIRKQAEEEGVLL